MNGISLSSVMFTSHVVDVHLTPMASASLSTGVLCKDCDQTCRRGFPGEKKDNIIQKLTNKDFKREFDNSNLAAYMNH